MSLQKCLFPLAVALLLLGLAFLAVGIALPIVIQQVIDAGLKALWMHPEGFESWGVVPGKLKLQVIREFSLFNISNPTEVIMGAQPILIEISGFAFQENSHFAQWTYMNDAMEAVGQDVRCIQHPDNFMAYNYEMTLHQLESEKTTQLLDQEITPFYVGFYGLSHAAYPLYSQQLTYDAFLALRDDMYPLVIAYVLWKSYYADSSYTRGYINGKGFSPETVSSLLSDLNYGFTSFGSLKLWVQATLQYKITQSWDDGPADILRRQFQVPSLMSLIAPESGWWLQVEAILTDMKMRYGSSDPANVAYLQWARLGVLKNLPLGLGAVNPPIYQYMNQSFDYALEIGAVVAALGVSVDYLPQAPSLLAVQYTYPMNNTSSLLSLQNMGSLFSNYISKDYSAILTQFQLQSVSQILPILAYLTQSGNYTITLSNGSTQYDGYSLALSRLVHAALVSATASLRYDVYYGLIAKDLHCRYLFQNVSCVQVVAQAGAGDAGKVCAHADIGWNFELDTWRSLQLWVEAAMKSSVSVAFHRLQELSHISQSDLMTILYTGPMAISNMARSIAMEISIKYSCKASLCSYDELFYLQLGQSKLTLDLLPSLIQCEVSSSTTISDWYIGRYRTPVEFLTNTKSMLPSYLTASYFTYTTFLSPTALKLFFNNYLAGRYARLQTMFAFPNTDFIDLFYTYFLSVIPGYGLLKTASIREILYGAPDPFLSFLSNLTIYAGGLPSGNPVYRMASETLESSTLPQHVIYTGKNDSSLTRNTYQRFRHSHMDMYAPGYDANSPTASAWHYTEIWNGDVNVTGSDGGQFGTYITEEDTIYAYITSVQRWFQLSFVSSETYFGLDLLRFEISPWQLANTLEDGRNAVFWQYPNSLQGYLNISSQVGAPAFVSLPHCYMCGDEGKNMVKYFAYSNDSQRYLSEQIFPLHEHDAPFASVEPLTGASLQSVLVFQTNLAVPRDYFFPYVFEPVPGIPLYFPSYILKRSINLTDSQVQENYGSLIFALKLKPAMLLLGTIVGSILLVASGLLFLKILHTRCISRPVQNDVAITGVAQTEEDVSATRNVTQLGEQKDLI